MRFIRYKDSVSVSTPQVGLTWGAYEIKEVEDWQAEELLKSPGLFREVDKFERKESEKLVESISTLETSEIETLLKKKKKK